MRRLSEPDDPSHLPLLRLKQRTDSSKLFSDLNMCTGPGTQMHTHHTGKYKKMGVTPRSAEAVPLAALC